MDQSSDDEYAFCVSSKLKKGMMPVVIGGVNMEVLVDSGASCNIMGKDQWQSLKSEGVKCKTEKCQKQLYTYGSKQPLQTLGKFSATVQIPDKPKVKTEFVVTNGNGLALLGCETTEKLGILKIGTDVNAVETVGDSKTDWVAKYRECFNGVGKLAGYQAKIHVDSQVNPVAQPVRRVPFGLRKRVESKLEELETLDIIEKVQGPTPWVSPIVIVPKSSGDVRLCIDMRRANEAVIRERHPIPTVDEVLQRLNDSKVFSKLDLKWGYHQIELEPGSRKITTFVTHKGLYQYKRLIFGIS